MRIGEFKALSPLTWGGTMGRSWEARVAEYVDSRRLACRVKIGDSISCAIAGNYGTYRTQLNLREPWGSSCTCPYDGGTCKHVAALRLTYEKKPRSFVNVDSLARRWARKPREDVERLLRRVVASYPQCVAALGVRGFRSLPEPEDEEERW